MATLFVGLGNMGAPMARRLAADAEIVLDDARAEVAEELAQELGVSTLASLGGDLTSLETVVLMLPNSRVVESVLSSDDVGLLHRLPDLRLVIDMGSSEPASTRRLAEVAGRRGVDLVDAPVSGGVAKARTGDLAIMVGGEDGPVGRATVLLRSMGSSVAHVGPVGAGHAVKALNNLLSATNVAAAAEVLTVARAFGVDPSVMVSVLNASTGRSQATEVKFPRHILTGTWDSSFPLDLMLKDLSIATDLADSLGCDLEVTASAESLARRARAALGEDRDHTEVARFIMGEAGDEDPSRGEA